MIGEHFKVFFITAYEINLDKKNLTRAGMNDLKKVYPPQPPKKPMHADKKYPMSIFCFDIIKEKLKKKYYDKNKRKYVARIKIKQESEKCFGLFTKTTEYEDFIYFEENRCNFIFDFEFKAKKSDEDIFFLLLSKNVSHTEQLKLYIEFFKYSNVDIDQKILRDLIEDAKSILYKGNYEFTFFLELFNISYLTNSIKDLLSLFEIEKVFPKDSRFEPKNYSQILDLIEKEPALISKHFSNDDTQEKYECYKQFYILLLYFRYKYDKKKVDDLLRKENLWVYFKEIIPQYYKTFENLNIPEGLIKEMASQRIESSQTIIKYISNYFIFNLGNKNPIFIKKEIINFLFRNSCNEFVRTLNEHFIIKEEELYNDERPNISFQILEIILKDTILFNKVFSQAKDYCDNISSLSNKILDDINNGNLQYSCIEPIFKNEEKKQIFLDKLKILLFFKERNYLEEATNYYRKVIENYISKIYQTIENLNDFEEALRLFFEANYINYIKITAGAEKIENVKNEITKGMLNILNKEYIKEELYNINQFNNSIPDFEKILNLKSSAIFLNLFYNYKLNKALKKTNENILDKSINDFEQFEKLFQKDWIKELDKNLLKVIKEIDDDKIEDELKLMKKYFNVKNLEIVQLKNEINIYKNNKYYYEISKNAFTISCNYENNNKNKELQREINNLKDLKELLSKEGNKVSDINDKFFLKFHSFFNLYKSEKPKKLEALCDKNDILNESKKKINLPIEFDNNENSNTVCGDSEDENIIYDKKDILLQIYHEWNMIKK